MLALTGHVVPPHQPSLIHVSSCARSEDHGRRASVGGPWSFEVTPSPTVWFGSGVHRALVMAAKEAGIVAEESRLAG